MDDKIFSDIFKVDYDNAKSRNESICKGAKYRFTILSDMLIRLEYSENGVFEDRPTELARFRRFDLPSYDTREEEGGLFVITTKYFELKYVKEQPFLGKKSAPDEFLKVKLNDTDKEWYYGHIEARNFKSNTISLDSMKRPPELNKGLYSTDGFVVLDDSKSLIFNQDGTVGKRSDERIDLYLFMYKKDFGFCLKNYYKLTGYPPLVPRYALGIWWDKNELYDKNQIKELVNKFKSEIPISAIILNKWPDINITEDKVEIINTITKFNIHPALKIKFNNVEIDGKNVPFNIFDKNFLKEYFTKVIDNLAKNKIDFLKLSYKDGDLYTLRMINYYFYKFFDASKRKRSLILSRNGLINAHLYPVLDVGETFVNWNTLNYLPQYNSTSSNIGVSYWSFPSGGFKEGIEDSELFTRYIQLSCYSPLFRFASKGGKYYKREPWRWDVKTRKIIRDYTTIRYRLIPYLYTEAYKYHKTGLPIVQPLYYRYPELYDEPTFKNEYYFGTELFVCPITTPKDTLMNRSIANLFLPNGTWYDFKTGKKFPGGKRNVSFYQDDDYPVFAKSGAIIPLKIYSENDDINDISIPKKLEVQIFPGKNNTYKLYEDDGTSKDYLNGKYLITAIDYNYLPNNYTVIIRPVEGDLASGLESRSYKIRFRNTRHADDVLVYIGKNPAEYSYYLDENDFIVEVDDVPTKEQLSINCKGENIEIDAKRVINEDLDRIISDLRIPTSLKFEINNIMFNNDDDIKQKRINVRKLKKDGLDEKFIKLFLKLLEYVAEV